MNIKPVHSIHQQHSNLKCMLIRLYRAPNNNKKEFIDRLVNFIYRVRKEKELILIYADWTVNYLIPFILML